jgi:hypothetical protein
VSFLSHGGGNKDRPRRSQASQSEAIIARAQMPYGGRRETGTSYAALVSGGQLFTATVVSLCIAACAHVRARSIRSRSSISDWIAALLSSKQVSSQACTRARIKQHVLPPCVINGLACAFAIVWQQRPIGERKDPESFNGAFRDHWRIEQDNAHWPIDLTLPSGLAKAVTPTTAFSLRSAIASTST